MSQNKQNTTVDRDATDVAAIDREYHWRPITGDTPRGTKMQLINRDSGVAVYATLATGPNFWTHYAPLPTFDPAEDAR